MKTLELTKETKFRIAERDILNTLAEATVIRNNMKSLLVYGDILISYNVGSMRLLDSASTLGDINISQIDCNISETRLTLIYKFYDEVAKCFDATHKIVSKLNSDALLSISVPDSLKTDEENSFMVTLNESTTKPIRYNGVDFKQYIERLDKIIDEIYMFLQYLYKILGETKLCEE